MPSRSQNESGPRLQDAASVRGSEFAELAAARVGALLPGVDVPSMELGFSLERTANAHMQQSESSVHRSLGISWSAFRVLYIIWIFEEVEARDVARLSGVTRQATSAVLKQLEANDLVTRTRQSEGDRRLLTIRLTDSGRALAENALRAQNALDQEWFSVLDDRERATLLDLLERVSQSISHSQRGRTV